MPSGVRADIGKTQVSPEWIGVGRAIGGAIIFSLPIMMTMEMWWIGFYIDPLRLILLILLSLPLFYGISTVVGFRDSKTFLDNLIDVLVAYAVTFITTAVVLLIFGVIDGDIHPQNILCMLLLQAVPGSLGALLARNVVGQSSLQDEEDERSYKDELTILAAGALFLALNIAPTEEVALISYRMTSWHSLALVVFTLFVMHAFAVASFDFSDTDLSQWSIHRYIFVRITTIGYMVALFISVLMLWIFESADTQVLHNLIKTAVVLGFPAGVGAAAARLII